jgi:hypothetical protein
VPTASSITVLPEALRLIQGDRTKETLWQAFSAANPGILSSIPRAQCSSAADTGCISDVALRLFNLKNPVTGDYVIATPRAKLPVVGRDGAAGSSVGGNPLVRQRNVVPAEFRQNQYTAKLDGQITNTQRLSATVFYTDFPGFDPFPDPASLASPFTLRRADRNATVAASHNWVVANNKRASAARSTTLARLAAIRPKRRSTNQFCARRRQPRGAIPRTRGSGTSAGTCCVDSGSGGSI